MLDEPILRLFVEKVYTLEETIWRRGKCWLCQQGCFHEAVGDNNVTCWSVHRNLAAHQEEGSLSRILL